MAEEADDLRGEIAKHLSDMEAPAETEAAPPQSTRTKDETAAPPAETDGRPRNPDGTFAKAEPVEEKGKRETLTLKTPPAPETPIPPGAAPSSPVQAQPVAPEIAAPAEWSGIAKIRWGKIPPEVRQEIVEHEERRAAAVADLVPVKELIDVNREFLVNQAGSLPAAFHQLVQFARMSVDNPAQLIQHIAQARGVNLAALVNGQPGDRPANAPVNHQPQDIPTLLAQIVDERLQPFKAQAEQQQTQQLQSTIDQFASRPDRPFFNDVRVHMGQLIQAGAAKTMDEAYEQATWANPAIRAHLLEVDREATEKAKAAEVQKARNAQRTAVTGSPLPGVGLNGKGDSKASALDDVRAAFNELSGA